MDATAARAVFRQRTLKGKLLAAVQAGRGERGEEAFGEAVMNASDLRSAFADLGDTVSSKDLFPLIQAADPDGDGVVTLKNFSEVVAMRRQQLEREREQASLVEAYFAMGGEPEREKSVASSVLFSVVRDFVGETAAARAEAAVVAHRKKAFQEVLDMGGSLDEDEEAEICNTSQLAFDELSAFASGLRHAGADLALTATSNEAESDSTPVSEADILR